MMQLAARCAAACLVVYWLGWLLVAEPRNSGLEAAAELPTGHNAARSIPKQVSWHVHLTLHGPTLLSSSSQLHCISPSPNGLMRCLAHIE